MSDMLIESVNPERPDLFDWIASWLEAPAFFGATAWFKYAVQAVIPS